MCRLREPTGRLPTVRSKAVVDLTIWSCSSCRSDGQQAPTCGPRSHGRLPPPPSRTAGKARKYARA